MRWFRRLLIRLLWVVALAGVGFVGWALWVPSPMPQALAALQSDAQVQVTTYNWLVFTPVGKTPDHGLIFYPGGRVDARAYAPAAHAMAAQGYLVVITPMPLNLAVFAPTRAAQVIAAYPQIKQWALAGHSLGGAMAANFVYNQPGVVEELIFWAAYPAGNNSLASRADVQVTSISGTLDGLATPAKIAASHSLLPANTAWVTIAGGNHAQFGWYGAQSGDNPATISREEQQQMVIAATLAALK